MIFGICFSPAIEIQLPIIFSEVREIYMNGIMSFRYQRKLLLTLNFQFIPQVPAKI